EWGANQRDAGAGVNGANVLTSSLYTNTSATLFASVYDDQYAQAGDNLSASRRYGSFLNHAYSFSSLVYQSTGSQTGTTQSAGTDTYSSVNDDSSVRWSSQGNITPPGNDTVTALKGVGSFTTTTESAYTSASSQAWSQTFADASTYSSYQAGEYTAGAYNL